MFFFSQFLLPSIYNYTNTKLKYQGKKKKEKEKNRERNYKLASNCSTRGFLCHRVLFVYYKFMIGSLKEINNYSLSTHKHFSLPPYILSHSLCSVFPCFRVPCFFLLSKEPIFAYTLIFNLERLVYM